MFQAANSLCNIRNYGRGAVLAEPFPGAVDQGVILVFIIANSRLYKAKMDLSTHTNQLETCWVCLQLATIFASVIFRRSLLKESVIGSIISLVVIRICLDKLQPNERDRSANPVLES